MDSKEKRIDQINEAIEYSGDYKRQLFNNDKEYRKKAMKPFEDFMAKQKKKKTNNHSIRRSELWHERIMTR